MSILPLDVLPDILESLTVHTLKNCSLVNHHFHQMTQGLLFSHLFLSSSTWRERCAFYLDSTNACRLAMVTKLSLNPDHLPVQDNVPPNLVELLVQLSSQIETLCIDGYFLSDGRSDVACASWSYISSVFRECLCQHIMPSVTSLQLTELGELPLFSVLKSCPLLRHLQIGSEFVNSTEVYLDGNITPCSLPDIVGLTLKPLSLPDLDMKRSLAHFIKSQGKRIASLRLVQPCSSDLRPGLDFLQPFPDLKGNLQHLYFGDISDEYNEAEEFIKAFNYSSVADFCALQTITIPIHIPWSKEEWDDWFHWISDYISSSSPPFPPLNTVRFSISLEGYYPDQFDGSPHLLDNLKDSCPFLLDFIVQNSVSSVTIDQTFTLVRATFPTWDEAARLNFWVES
ncbi:hypothetical protein DL96DRAFT_1643383 [Flagelloscypha sp. PMI_526]|nr:hypothetical protein DL96DRAFT_1643383 [Flagelloscypha sp. PMI_526]